MGTVGPLGAFTLEVVPTSYYMQEMAVPSENGDDNIFVKNGLSLELSENHHFLKNQLFTSKYWSNDKVTLGGLND